jgi:hypothetical protein
MQAKMKLETKHNYHVCTKCAKKGAYLYTPLKGEIGTAVSVEYCKFCTPRTGASKAVVKEAVEIKPGILARLRGLFAG